MLRQYQKDACNAVVSWFNYHDTPAIVVVATGGGKSHIIASLADYYAKSARVLIIAHRKELLQQTGKKITSEVGFYSASLGEKDISKPITVAGIQSVYDVVSDWNYIFVDECQFLSNNTDDGMYWKLINNHPRAKICGFTATPYRLKGGKLGWGEVIYEINYPALLAMGYLAPISNKLLMDCVPNLDHVEIKLGDYVENQLAEVMEDPALIQAAIKAIMAYGVNRYSCLIFTVSVRHGELLRDALQLNGIDSVMVSGKSSDAERAEAVTQFKHEYGNVRYLINCEIFLVGFDAPNVDAIFCLRPTKSKALWEQMMGRGVRIAEGKKNCLLVDMAGNLAEHGGMGEPYREKARKESKQNKGKICPECEEFTKPAAKECPDCGYVFPPAETAKVTHEYEADIGEYKLSGDICDYDVTDVQYKFKTSKKGSRMIVVSYYCGYGKYGTIADFLLPYHEQGFLRDKVKKFFTERGAVIGDPRDMTEDELLWQAEALRKPARITVDHREEWPRIINYHWPEPETTLEEYLNDGIPC
jgi:DNA repair protein RadD